MHDALIFVTFTGSTIMMKSISSMLTTIFAALTEYSTVHVVMLIFLYISSNKAIFWNGHTRKRIQYFVTNCQSTSLLQSSIKLVFLKHRETTLFYVQKITMLVVEIKFFFKRFMDFMDFADLKTLSILYPYKHSSTS
ncbi:hypothetical protein SDJN02_20458, partial [Cucurbita argyrosperma subsp. argyrosperma]